MKKDMNQLNNELLSIKEQIHTQAPAEKLDKRHSAGKLTARERIEYLLDPGSFQEIDMFVSEREGDSYGDGVITGFGTINNRMIYIYAQDFMNRGGTFAEMHSQKICKIQDMALDNGAPIIALNDSGGARIQEGVSSLGGVASVFYRNAQSSGVIPQISAIMGPCAGGAVYSPALMDFIIMVKNTSNMFITGPDVIKEVTNEVVSFEELGGSEIHTCESGVAHFEAENEEDCFELIRKLLSYLPQNNLDVLDFQETDSEKDLEYLNTFLPDDDIKAYSMHEAIDSIFDENSFFEVAPNHAANIIVGFSRLNGMSIGIVANNPQVLAGTIDINASLKAARFIRFCDCFNIPIITLEDVPGFLPGVEQERNGIIKHGAKLLFAYCEATVPKITVILRKSYGGTYCVMNSKHIGADFVFAWPSAQIAVMGAKGAINIINRKEIQAASNKEEAIDKLVDQYNEDYLTPYKAAKLGFVDDIILPKDTRKILINALRATNSKKIKRPARKHGNIPL